MNTHNQNERVSGGQHRPTPLRDRVLSHAPTPLSRFEQAVDAVERDDCGKHDYRYCRSQLRLENGALCLPDSAGERGTPLQPTRWAQGQLCNKLGIPAAYFAACPPLLQDIQANHWLERGPVSAAKWHETKERLVPEHDQQTEDGLETDKPRAKRRSAPTEGDEQWLVRAKGDRLRAVLSSSYSPLDSKLVMETLAPLLGSHLRVDWFALSGEAMHLRIVDPSQTRDVLPGDGLSVGVHISNSEVGAKCLCVDALVYRLVCSNGLIALVKGQSLLRRRHVHIEAPRFRAALEEAFESAFAVAHGLLEQLQGTTRQRVPDPELAIDRLGQQWNLSEPVREAAKVALWQENAQVRSSAYGVVNAFTNVAQLLSEEKRYDLEVLAGHLAQSGVPAFALAPREKSVAVNGDVAALAQDKFEAQVIGRRPLAPTGAGTREVA